MHVTFLSLPSEELAVARVAERVRQSGHNVPEPVIRRRFTAGLRNLLGLYRGVTDTWQLWDNSELGRPLLIASGRGEETRVVDETAWRHVQEMAS